MSLSQKIASHLPYLRRYARALTGSQSVGDAMVRKTLEVALADEALRQSLDGGRVPLYRLFLQVLAQEKTDPATGAADTTRREAAAQDRLGAITPASRKALLLTTVEEFSLAEAAQVMGLELGEIESLVANAIEELDGEQLAQVMIIEDEPMIMVQLEDLVLSMGHHVCGRATTHSEAVRAVQSHQPDLVLADIQLADGSSGVEAVAEILTQIDVPVIFITGFPERLLTGETTEPTYLVTKPFREETVKATISQALFFAAPRHKAA